MMWKHVGLLGRDRLLEKLLPRALGKKPEFLLVGARGVGKSSVLEWCFERAREAGQTAALVSCDDTVKQVLAEICSAWKLSVYRGDKIVSPHQAGVEALNQAIMKVSNKKSMLFIDDMHMAKPALLKKLKVWRERFTVYACGVKVELTKRESLKRCLFGYREIEIPVLSEEFRLKLAEAVCVHVGSSNSPSEIAAASGGMPARIVAMAQAEVEIISPRVKGEELNLSPVFLMLGGLAVGLRYLGSGLNQTDLYLLGGLGMAIFICLRYVLLPGMSRG